MSDNFCCYLAVKLYSITFYCDLTDYDLQNNNIFIFFFEYYKFSNVYSYICLVIDAYALNYKLNK